MLKLSDGLRLPLDAVTETFAILGRRGSGKTHTAVVMAEEMLAAGVPVVVVDPLDVWWGLRVSKDGKKAGFPIYVCGGSHEDVPLTADAGRVLADAIVDRGLSMVLSIRHLSKTDQRRFVGDFCDRLYDRKADPKHRTALHVFIDEADAFVPQRLVPGAERCYGAVDTMVRRGRSSGLAVTLISQRPQVIAKDVLSQTEVLVAHQLTGPQDRKALEAWIEANDTENRRAEFMGSLASLQKGDTWFWSPGMLGIFTRVHIRDRHTFDSSATPKPGVATAAPKAFAPVDLEKLTAEIAATIEKAKADDPRELRRQIADLKRQAAESQHSAARNTDTPGPKRIEVPVLKDGQLARAEKIVEAVNAAADRMKALGERLSELEEDLAVVAKEIRDAITKTCVPQPITPAQPARTKPLPPQGRPQPGRRAVPAATASRPASGNPETNLGKCERAILTVLAQQPDGCTAGRLTLLTRYRYSGGFKNSLSTLRQAGLMAGENTGTMRITDAGLAAIGEVDALPTGDELAQYWLTHQSFGKCERAILGALLDHPKGLTADQLCQATSYQYSGGFKNSLSDLRTAGVLIGKNTDVMRASEELFS